LRRLFSSILIGLVCVALGAAFDRAMAQEELPLSKITSRPTDPFKANEQDVIRGMWFNLFADRRLPKWRNEAEFKQAKLPADIEDRRREEWQREAQKMEAEKGFGVRRMLHQLQIKLRDGRFIYFTDKYTGDQKFRQVDIAFNYREYDKRRRLYFVDWYWYENGGLAIISADTGLFWTLDGSVYPAPDGSRLAGFDNYGGPEQFSVLRLDIGSAIYEIEEIGSAFIRAIESQNVNDMHWDGNTTIHFRRNLDTQMLLRRTNNEWKIEALSEPIPETVSCSWSWSGNIGFPDSSRERLCRKSAVAAGVTHSSDVSDVPVPQLYIYTIRDPVHGRVNPDWLCIFERRNC
jgi:hypothetical protein